MPRNLSLNNDVPSSLAELVSSISVQVGKNDKFTMFKRTYARDRVAFVYDVMPAVAKTITPYQLEILGNYDAGITRQAIRGPHGLGKTFLAAILTHHAVLTTLYDCKVATTASAWRQLEKYLWPEIKKLGRFLEWSRIGRHRYDTRTELHALSIKLQGGTVEAFAIASDDHNLIEGAHATRMVYVFDEAKTIPAATWDAAEGAFSTEGLEGHGNHEAFAFAISTPGDPSGRFYEIHSRQAGYEDWHVRHVTIDEAINAGRISPLWVENRRKQWGEDSTVFKNRVLGEFADNSEEGLIPLSWVQLAIERWHEWDRMGRPRLQGIHTIGVDVAREGNDSTVFASKHASVVQNVKILPNAPTTRTTGTLVNFARKLGSPYVHIEMDGIGAAVYDQAKEAGLANLRKVVVSASTAKTDRSRTFGFVNVRSAMWWNLREMLDPAWEPTLALPPHTQMIGDLTGIRWEATSSGKIKVESRYEVKKRIGRSPDVGTAVALSCWHPRTGGGVVV